MLGSERFSAVGWVSAERLAALGRHLLGFPQTGRRALAAAPASAAPQAAPPGAAPAAAPLADVDSRPCQAIQDAAGAGTPLNFTSVEAFCLNQVLARAAWRLVAGACVDGGRPVQASAAGRALGIG